MVYVQRLCIVKKKRLFRQIMHFAFRRGVVSIVECHANLMMNAGALLGT